ncbi:hypothetical protein AMJ85_09530 [candidate division BRC1 bacterium SM23_51]|nr:MAG: hypothetical protein AMJ85_09530 [candidate division BRC1 bacterium SM23_51]
MFRGILRTVLIVILAIILLSLALKFLTRAIALVVLGGLIFVGLYAIRLLWRGGGASKCPETERDGFLRRYPRLARLERRIEGLEGRMFDKAR